MSMRDPLGEPEDPPALTAEIMAALAWLYRMSPGIVLADLLLGAAAIVLPILMRPGGQLAGLSATISPDALGRSSGAVVLPVLAVMLGVVVWGTVVTQQAQARLLLGLQRVEQARRATGDHRASLLHEAIRVERAAALGMLRLGGRAGYSGYAAALNAEGIALKQLAEDATGEEQARLLRQAADTFRAAAEAFALKPNGQRAWAEARTNLGATLIALAARRTGAERVGLLREAVAIEQSALAAHSSHGSPSDWATTANGLAVALGSLAELTDGAERVRLLGETVRVHREIAEMREEARGRLSWAAMNNQGISLMRQAKETDGDERHRLLAEAIACLQAALSASTRATAPRDWAMTQSNLAGALGLLGEQAVGRERAELAAEAVAACRAALTVRTRTAMPLQWARTMNNLSDALRVAAEAHEGEERTNLLSESAAACVEALRLPLRTMDPQTWAEMHINLGRALTLQAETAPWVERRQLALAAMAELRSALEVYTQQDMPVDHRRTVGYLGRAQAALA